jgi:hypothetical protein
VTSRPQISLSIASGDNGASAAHSTKGGGCFKAQFPGFGRDEVGDLMGFELPPHILDGIEFGSVSGQPFDHDASLGGSHMVFDQGAAMDRSAIPEDQHFPWDVALEVSEEFDHLRALDAAGMDLEIEAPEGQAPDDRETFPVEGFVQKRSLSARRPGAHPGGAGAQAAFVEEDDGAPLLAGLFLRPASPPVASGGWPFRRVPRPGVLGAGN